MTHVITKDTCHSGDRWHSHFRCRMYLRIKPAKPFDAAVNLSLPSRIAIIGNYLPRQCGIATFTTDLCDAVSAEYGTRTAIRTCR